MPKTKLAILFIAFFFLKGQAQDFSDSERSRLNELNQLISDKSTSDSTLAIAYLELSDLYYYVSLDSMILFSEKSNELCEKLILTSKDTTALHQYKTIRTNALSNQGVGLKNKGEVKKALDVYYQALDITEELNDKLGYAILLGNIGIINKNQGELKKAEENYLESLAILEEINDSIEISYMLLNVGSIYLAQNKLEKSLIYYYQSKEKLEHNNEDFGLAVCLSKIGLVYSQLDRLDEALELYLQSIEIDQEIHDDQGIAQNYIGIAELYFKKTEFKKAESYALQARDISLTKGFVDQTIDASLILSKIYKKQKRGMEALEMFEEYIVSRDSLRNQSIQKEIATRQLEYKYEKQKAIDDAVNEKKLALETNEKEKQRIISYSTAGGLGLAVLFLLFIFNRLNVTRKQKSVIELQKSEVEKQKSIIEVTHKEITDSIAYAKRIQAAILPPEHIFKDHLGDSFVYYRPKDVVAGDFYWMRKHEGKTMWAVADCTGHGVPGALVSVVCNNALNRSIREDGLTDPGKILDRTREIVIREFEKSEEEVKDGMDIALCVMEGNTLKYSGAYNSLWIIREGKFIIAKADRQAIGAYQLQQPFTTHEITLQRNDMIYIFSDGFYDQFGGKDGKKFKVNNFKELMLSMHYKSTADQQVHLERAFNEWKGAESQVDDVCIIGVRIN